MGMGAVLEQEQEEGRQVGKRVIAYASKMRVRGIIVLPTRSCWQL